MTLQLTGKFLDIIIIGILIFSFIFGYKKGIVDRVTHFVTTLFIFALSWFLSKPLAGFFAFQKIEGFDPGLIKLIAPVIGRVLGFVVIFIVLSLIRTFVLMVLHRAIDGIKKHLSLVRWVDNGLGALFNVAKNTLFIYVILIAMCLPVFTNGSDIVRESKVGVTVLKVSPQISEEIMSFGQQIIAFVNVDEWVSRDFNMKDMVELLDAMVSMDVLDEEDLKQFYFQYQSQIDQIPSVCVSVEDYQHLMQTIEHLPANEQFKNVARSKITTTR